MKKIEVTQEEWDAIADSYTNSIAGKTRSLSHAMDLVTTHMSQYKIIKKKNKK